MSLPGLNFTDRMHLICVDMTQCVPALSHIDMRKVAVGFCQTRVDSPYGRYATLVPLRFQNGAEEEVRRGRKVTLQKIINSQGIEMLYLLNFYVPRYFKGNFNERISTIAHELMHISPRFDGDIRRFAGRCYAHSGNQKKYDAIADSLAQEWLAKCQNPDLYDFLQLSFEQMLQKYGRISGSKYKSPKIIPVK